MSKLLVVRGIQDSPRGYNNDNAQNGANDHNLGTSARLTAQSLGGTQEHYANGISVDQEMAKSLNPMGRQAMTLGTGRRFDGADGNISYLASGQPAPRQDNPWLAYQSFMSGGSMPDTSLHDQIINRRKSVLDLVKHEMDALNASPKLSQDDKKKLDLHYTNIRDVEVGVASTPTTMGVTCAIDPSTLTALQGVSSSGVNQDPNMPMMGKLQMDVLALALACGYTRVASLMWGSGEGGPVFSWLGHNLEHHLISHQVVDYTSTTPLSGAHDMLHQIDQWYCTQLAYFLGKLDAYKEGNGSVLDNSVVLLCNELSDGSIHSYLDLPFVIAGSGGGYLKQGQYIKVASAQMPSDPYDLIDGSDAPHNKLLTTLLNAVGAKQSNGMPYTNFGAFGRSGEYTQLKA
jgi:hypothetical protein